LKKVVFLAGVFLLAAVAAPAFGDPHSPRGGEGGPIACNDGEVTWSPTNLWPPNHKLNTIDIYYTDDDGDGDMTTVEVTGFDSSDGVGDDEINGSGNTDPDVVPGAPGTATDPEAAHTTADVRAERSGHSKDGRTYTLDVQCTDSGGSDMEMESETVPITVTVPHDQGNHGN
jgi:hypothetical protein